MRHLLVLLLAAGCAGAASDSGDTDAADTDVAVTCTALPEGMWDLNGTCFGMLMSGVLTLDESGCRFTFDEWSMQMDMPGGGRVDGDTVTFTGRNWRTCTGEYDNGRVDGGCDNGCEFRMAPQE